MRTLDFDILGLQTRAFWTQNKSGKEFLRTWNRIQMTKDTSSGARLDPWFRSEFHPPAEERLGINMGICDMRTCEQRHANSDMRMLRYNIQLSQLVLRLGRRDCDSLLSR